MYKGGQRGEGRGFSKERRTHLLREGEGESDTEESSTHTIYSVSQEVAKVAPITRTVKVNGTEVMFEIDTGCGVTIVSKRQYVQLWKKTAISEMKPCLPDLKTYTGGRLGVLGRVQVQVQGAHTERTLPVVVVEGDGPNLLGRSWLRELSLADQLVNKVVSAPPLQLVEILKRHAEVFEEGLGQLKNFKAKIDEEIGRASCRERV